MIGLLRGDIRVLGTELASTTQRMSILNGLYLNFVVSFTVPQGYTYDHFGVYQDGMLWLRIPLNSKGVLVRISHNFANGSKVVTLSLAKTLRLFQDPWYTRLWRAVKGFFLE
jgi:hypothetical protein